LQDVTKIIDAALWALLKIYSTC